MLPLRLTLLAATMLVTPVALSAQDASKAKPDSAMKVGSMDDHMMGPWKEMNAFHRVMSATWHPASKGDLAPLRARGKELGAAAESWSASKPPAMPASCGSDAVKGAVSKVAAESKALATLLSTNADDARLTAALKSVHDTFEAAEKGCAGHGEHGRMR